MHVTARKNQENEGKEGSIMSSSDSDATPDTKPDTKPKAKPDTQPETKPDTKPNTKPEAKPDTKPDTKPEAKSETKPDTKPEAKPDTKPEAKPEAKPTKPVAKPVPKPTSEEKPLPEFEKGLSDKITTKFGQKIQIRFVKPDRVGIKVARENIREVAIYLRDQLNFDHAESVTGVDYPADKEIEVVYHLGSYSDDSLSRQVLELATRSPREETPNPGKDSTILPSLRDVFYSVEFHERECFEMLGVYFDGHPDNRRLLLPEDWADLPPMRKDFAIKGR